MMIKLLLQTIGLSFANTNEKVVVEKGIENKMKSEGQANGLDAQLDVNLNKAPNHRKVTLIILIVLVLLTAWLISPHTWQIRKLYIGNMCNLDGLFPATNQYGNKRLKIHMMATNQLGNMLFHMASCYGIAKTNDRQCVYHLATTELCDDVRMYFEGIPVMNNTMRYLGMDHFLIDTDPIEKEDIKCKPAVYKVDHNFIPTKWFLHLPSREIYIGCNTCRYTFFNKYVDDIRKLFKFSPEVIRNAKERIFDIYKSTNASDIIYIGIHNRRGDFLTQKSWLEFPKTSYFEKASDYYIKKYSQSTCVFLVFSNDMKWSKPNINLTDKHIHFIEGQSAVEDMATMSLCNHSIITFGTFSWWAGFFTGGDVIYYKAHNQKKQYYPSDERNPEYYIESWITI